MATMYLRGNVWWLSWYVRGERLQKSSGLMSHEKEKALQAKAKLERELKARKDLAQPGSPSKTFAGYRKQWIRNRELRGVGSVRDDENWLKHARELDALDMAEVRPRHIRDVVFRLRREDTLAPRSIRHVFSTLHRLFQDARVDEVVESNPCVLSKGDLPGKVDKDPTWRSGAVFARSEVEQLLSDKLVPEQRKVLYALLFCGGMRIGEVAALRWRSYDKDVQPLGKLTVAVSYSRKKKKEKGLKVEGQTREVPVHPTLAAFLSEWKLGGWARQMGRPPKLDDLLVPSPVGNNLRDPVVHANLLRDLTALGLRPRRTHDARRTFISLALADGARKDILKWVTHGPSGDIIDLYTTIPWATLCAEVAKLNIRPRDTATVSLHPKTASQKE